MIMVKDSNNNYVKIKDIKQQNSFNGVSPIEFKGSGKNLENYRIYGNTVGGELVGDRTGNLFDSNINVISGYLSDEGILRPASETSQITFDYIPIISGTYTFTYTVPSAYELWFGVCTYDESRTFQSRLVSEYSGAATFTIPDTTKYIRISLRGYNKTPIIMLNEGSTPLPYEPYGYKVPVTVSNDTDTLTTPIYLPEPIKMVGDEAEYVDYKEQKQHRVRKNLLQNIATSQTKNGVTFTVNSDGSIVCDGQASPSTAVLVYSDFLVPSGTYIFTGCPNGGSERETYKMLLFINGAWFANDTGSGANFTLTETSTVSVRIDIYNGYTCDNLTFYPMLRLASIEDDTYEPYITNTELDITLPALPTLLGTNTLSVGTDIKPSKVWGRLSDLIDILYVKDNLGNILFSKYPEIEYPEIEDEPPLSFRARSGILAGYKLYGNLRHEESPNLIIDWLSNIHYVSSNTATLSKTSTSITITAPDDQAFVGNWSGSDSKVTVKPSTIYRLSWAYNGQGKSKVGISFNCTANSIDSWLSPWTTWTRLDSGSVTFTTPSDCSNIGIRFETGPEDDISPGIATISQLMLEENPSGAVVYRPYGGQILAVGDYVSSGTYAGKYKIPVTITGENTNTTDIYLDAPLRRVGAYADYIDYERQKVCRVIKTVTSDGLHWNSYQPNNQYDIHCGYLTNNRLPLVNDNAVMTESSLYPGASAVDEWANRSTTDYKCIAVNDTYYEFLVVDNVSFPDRNLQAFQNLLQQLDTAGNPFEIWYINSDSENVSDPPTAAVYEEETVTLPLIQPYIGTNTITVETDIQPSSIYIKGRIEEIENG